MDKLKNRIREQTQEMEIETPKVTAWENIKSLLTGSNIDLLRAHIQKFRSELEVDTPQNWEHIRAHILTKQSVHIARTSVRRRFLIAACFILLAGLGFIWYLSKEAPKPDSNNAIVKTGIPQTDLASQKVAEKKSGDTMEEPSPGLPVPTSYSVTRKTYSKKVPVVKLKTNALPPELLQIQEDYDNLIASQISYTKSLPVYGENASYFYEFMVDLRSLDEQEKQLRSFILTNTSDQNKIFELAMIYQQKLTVLKKLQNEINKTSIRNRNEKDTLPVYLSL